MAGFVITKVRLLVHLPFGTWCDSFLLGRVFLDMNMTFSVPRGWNLMPLLLLLLLLLLLVVVVVVVKVNFTP